MSYDGQLWHEMMLERQHQLEDALTRAEAGTATPEDWNIIRYECGVSPPHREVRFNTNLGELDEFSSEK
jgi:hypothetical protein